MHFVESSNMFKGRYSNRGFAFNYDHGDDA